MAGRKDKNTVDYFPHYCVSGKTIFILESKFGHLGYSVWFKTLELLGGSENHFIDLREDTDLLFLISKMKITEQQLKDIYDLLAKLDAIDMELWNEKIIYSENFIKNISDAYKRRSKDVYNKDYLCKHILNLCIHKSNKSEHKPTKKSKVKKRKVKKSKGLIFPFDSENFKSYWNLWKQYKYSDHKFAYKSSISEQAALKKLSALSENNEKIACAIIENSIAQGYKGLFKLNDNGSEQKRIKIEGEIFDIANRIKNDPNLK